MSGFTLPALLGYGALRLPLAMLELPLYVLLPSLYGRSLGVDLAVVGAVLFGARLVDALADPAIGLAIDRWRTRWPLHAWIRIGLPPMVVGLAALLVPPVPADWLAPWLAVISVLTYVAYSCVSIAYQAWGASLGDTEAERARVTTTREAFGLFGVIAAAALLSPARAGWLAAIFAVLAVCAMRALRHAPPPHRDPAPDARGNAGGWRMALRDPAFRWLLAAYLLNGIATAVPATLVLFFVEDVLGAGHDGAPLFLAAYFLAGALGMPLWDLLARRIGLRQAWLAGMALSVIGFVWTLGLGRGDTLSFLAVCIATGLALGSDLAMPPAMLAATIAGHGQRGRGEGAYFGLWNLVGKLNPAIAAGLALPLLQRAGYAPGLGGDPLPLSLAYAALPSALKLAAGALLLLSPLPEAADRTAAARPLRSEP